MAAGPSFAEISGANRAEVVEAVRKVLIRDVDSKVSEKVEELWNKGKTMLGQVNQRQQKKSDELSTEISLCLEKQRTLEAENEQLKQVITGLAARLSMLGSAFGGLGSPGCCPPSEGPTTAGSSVASASPGTRTSTDSLYSPVGAGQRGADSFTASLPEVPAFPFPPAPTTGSSAAPLSLAEALGSAPCGAPTGGPMALSLASSLLHSSPEASSPLAASAGPAPMVFSFTLRKADETDLGLNVSQHEVDKVLLVEGVRPDGAVDAWNRQCMGGAFAEKAVMRGDRIVGVNSVSYDPEKMLEECKEKQLLRLTLVRGDMPLPEMPLGAAPGFGLPTEKKPTSLRADACEFVPMGASVAKASVQEAEPEKAS